MKNQICHRLNALFDDDILPRSEKFGNGTFWLKIGHEEVQNLMPVNVKTLLTIKFSLTFWDIRKVLCMMGFLYI